MTIRKILILALALLALAVISVDYTYGHTLDDIVNPEFYCPICDAFHAAVTGVFLLYILILLGFIPVLRHTLQDSGARLLPSCAPSVISYRAPPATLRIR